MDKTTRATTVICLKGRLHEFGPQLEHAGPDVLYVGRRLTMGGWNLPESVWANPFTVKDSGSPERAVERYVEWAENRYLLRRLPELRGRVLACWCGPGAPCHARYLADRADGRASR